MKVDSSRDDTVRRCRVCGRAELTRLVTIDQRKYWRCKDCEAIFADADELPTRAEELEQYLLHENDVTNSDYRVFVAQLVDPLVKQLKKGAAGLDFGCGPGPIGAMMLRERGFSVAEYDPFFAPDRAEYDPFFARSDPVLSRQYDFIFCCEVFEHFHDPFREIARLDRLLRPGGWLGVMTQFDNPNGDFNTWHYRRDPTHVVFYREETFVTIARDRGWTAFFPRLNVALFQKNQ